jgi:hypothetical protein
MEERRHLQRHTVLKSAKIVFDSQSSLVDCIVYNLTSKGACLQLANTMSAPESFEMSFDNFRSARSCRVTWRQSNKLGVSFC